MKKSILAAVVATATVAMTAFPANASAQNVKVEMPNSANIHLREAFPSYIEVTGYAERNVTPDIFYLDIVITEKDSKGKLSVESQQRDMSDALRRLGVDTEKQLTVVNMTSEYFKKTNSLATAQYRLKLGSAADVRNVYAALGELGISNVSIRSVSHSDIKAIREEVRLEAMRNAKSRAASLAEAIEQTAGECFYIRDWGNDGSDETVVAYGTMRKAALMSNADAEEASDEPLEFKPIKVSHRVDAKFVLRGRKNWRVTD